MNKVRWKRLGTVAAAAAALFGASVPAGAAAGAGGGPVTPVVRPDAQVKVRWVIDGLPNGLGSVGQRSGQTVMVPAKMLENLGYRLAWDPQARRLTAVRSSGASLVFRAGSREAHIGGKGTVTLDAAPYIEEGRLWIPLRAAAEGSGLEVGWDAEERTATVRDPNALKSIRVATRADNGADGDIAKLDAYIRANMKLNVELMRIPPEYYHQKTMLMIAAGDPTDLMLIDRPYQFNDALMQSVASDLTDQLAAYPRLKALAESEAASARSIGGRPYGIPRPSDPHDAPFPAVRRDWLDKLGLATPATMDELYEVLVRFVQSDPDGNGKSDTVGLTGRIAGDGLGTLAWVEQAYTGSPGRFAVVNGEVRDTAANPAERQALAWLARAYRDGVLDPDFAALTDDDVRQRMEQGRAGMAAVTVAEAARLTGGAGAAAGGPVWTPLPGLRVDEAGPVAVPWNTAGSGLYIVPRTVPKEKADAILAWLDRGVAMAQSGEWDRLPELDAASRAAAADLFGSVARPDASPAVAHLPDSVRRSYADAVSSWEQTSYAGRTLPQAELVLSQEAYIEMNRQLEELKIRVITGQASLDDWDRHVAEMKQSDLYRAMMKALNALL